MKEEDIMYEKVKKIVEEILEKQDPLLATFNAYTKEEVYLHSQIWNTFFILHGMSEYLREERKYNDSLNNDEQEMVSSIEEKFYSFLNEYGFDLDQIP